MMGNGGAAADALQHSATIAPVSAMPSSNSGDVILSLYRDRIIAALGVAATIVFLPFAINNFIEGRNLLGGAATSLAAIFVINAVAVRLGKNPPIPMALAFIPMVVSLPLAIRTLGFVGMLWCYPAVLLFFFVLPRRLANLLAVGIAALVAPLVVEYGGVQGTVRFASTLGLVIVFSNIFLSIIGELHKKLSEQAVRDPLTGTYNRRHMEDLIGAIVARAERTSLMLIDIDHFKKVNDEYGHAAGDRVIREVAAAAEQFDPAFTVFRIGGEEFAVLVRGKSEAAAAALADELRERIASGLPNTPGTVTISIGVAEALPGESQDGWLKRADSALYCAKRDGRNCVRRAVLQSSSIASASTRTNASAGVSPLR